MVHLQPLMNSSSWRKSVSGDAEVEMEIVCLLPLACLKSREAHAATRAEGRSLVAGKASRVSSV